MAHYEDGLEKKGSLDILVEKHLEYFLRELERLSEDLKQNSLNILVQHLQNFLENLWWVGKQVVDDKLDIQGQERLAGRVGYLMEGVILEKYLIYLPEILGYSVAELI